MTKQLLKAKKYISIERQHPFSNHDGVAPVLATSHRRRAISVLKPLNGNSVNAGHNKNIQNGGCFLF